MRIQEDEALRAWRETVAAFVTDDVGVEYCRECYRNGEYPHAVYDGVVERGWIGLLIPEAHGGRGGTYVEQAVLLEALGRYGYDFGVPVLVATTAAENVLRFGTTEQVERFVPRLLDGSIRFSIGVTEPSTGSDAASIETRARRRGDHYVLDGEKTYQSGAHAPGNRINCYVKTDPEADRRAGLSVLLVPNDAPGVTVRRLPLVARTASGTNHVSFEDARVPVENRLGREGQGWEILGHHLLREHAGMAALMVGTAQTAVDTALDHAADRERFGRPVTEFQAVSHRLADMQTEVDAARLLVYRAMSAIDDGRPSRLLAAQAKLKAGEVLQSVSQAGVQILGGAGLHPENDMERYWREGKSATIAGGTSEIQRSVVAHAMLDDR